MTHFTEIKTQIKDIEALRLACAELRLTLLQNTEARGYYENKTKGDYVIQLKGPYDIALNKQADGTFGLTANSGRVTWKRRSAGDTANSFRLRGPKSNDRSQEEGVVRSSPPSTKRGHQTRAHGGINEQNHRNHHRDHGRNPN